jgi:flagellar biosynthesis protein FlhF
MTDVRTFRAATMQEALDLVRDELGADAVILHTRQVARRRFLPWRKPIEEVEIAASLFLNTPEAADPRRPKRRLAEPGEKPPRNPLRRPTAAPARRIDLVSEPAGPIGEMFAAGGAGSEPDADSRSGNRRSQSFFQKNPPAARSREAAVDSAAPSDHAGSRSARRNRFTGEPMGNAAADPTAALSKRLDAIQQMIRDLGRSGAAVRSEEIPNELFHVYTDLIDAEVEETVARDLVFKLRRTASSKALGNAAAAKSLLTSMVESEIRCCEPISVRPGRRKVAALVGATGVGKTTTIAKLAANFRLRGGVRTGLVTVDTYRVAAVEQLRTYAEIIDLPMKVVTSPPEMRRALEELAGLDLVLIDTAGRSPRDELQIKELKALLTEASVDEVHLVLSMTSSLRTLEASAAQFAAAGTTALILTKLDEASGMGSLLSVARKIGLPISYLTMGQDVPDDIEPAHPTRIARLILGQERVAT